MTNYFELFEIPVSFHPDQGEVKKKYYELSRKYHPDRFTQATGREYTEVLQLSAKVNDAFKVLKNPDATMAYILKMNNLLQDEEKYPLSPDFLMEMMELNELAEDLEPNNEPAKVQVEATLKDLLDQWEQEVSALTNKYDDDQGMGEKLLQIKDYYFRKKYLLRIKERIDKFAAHQ